MFDHMDGIMWALPKKNTPWKEDLYIAVKLAQQKLSKYYAEVTPMTGMLHISAHILNRLSILQSFTKWYKGLVINHDDETSHTTRYQETFLKYAENEYCAKHGSVPVIDPESEMSNNVFPSATASGSGQSSFDWYDLSSDDEEYLLPNNVAEMTPGWRDRAAPRLAAARLYLNSLPESPKNWEQVNLCLNGYHCEPKEISSTFWLPDITDWWRKQEETHSKYADLSKVVRDIFSIIPHGVGVEASFTLGRDVIRCRQSKTTGETLHKIVIVRLFARANNVILAGDDPTLQTVNIENDSEMKREAEEWQLPRMAKVHELLEMWQGSQKLRATQKESCAQTKQMTALEYILDTEEIVKVSCSLVQHDGAAAFKLSERSPLPPAFTAKDLPEGWSQILNIRRIRRIDHHPVESDADSAPASISDTKNRLNWNGNLDYPNDSEDDCMADFEYHIEWDIHIEDPESPGQPDVSAPPNIPG